MGCDAGGRNQRYERCRRIGIVVDDGVNGEHILDFDEYGVGRYLSVERPDGLHQVGDTYANTNYGTATYLTVKNDGTGYFRNSYLKFNLSSIASPIKKATVYLVAVSEGTSGFTNQAFLVTNNSWTETGITWNNAPVMSTTLPGSWTVPATGSQVAFDVTAQALSAQSNGNLLSIGITSPTNAGSTAWVEYGSKENGTIAYRPVLVVNTQ